MSTSAEFAGAAAMVNARSAPSLDAGITIGRFTITRKLGGGGLGTVYEAVDNHGVTVALKVICMVGDLGRAETETLEREVATTRHLEHPNIVKALDAGVHGNLAYLALEFIPGTDLDRHTQAGHLLPPQDVLEICASVAEGLAHAHRQGIVHRDVKPGNILVDGSTGNVKLADFGIAQLGDAFRTRTGIVQGTPVYMSPEQLSGGPASARSDLYSLGAVLFELLAGRRPHDAQSMGELLRRVAREEAPTLAATVSGIPDEVSRFVASLLDREPDRRPSDAAEVAATLKLLAKSWPHGVTAAGSVPKSRR